MYFSIFPVLIVQIEKPASLTEKGNTLGLEKIGQKAGRALQQ